MEGLRHLSISPDRVVCHDREEVVPGVDGVQPAPLPPPVVGGDPVLPTTLDVQRDQVHSKPSSGFWKKEELKEIWLNCLEWIVSGHLGTDGWSPPVTLSRQRPGKPGRQQMACEYHLRLF